MKVSVFISFCLLALVCVASASTCPEMVRTQKMNWEVAEMNAESQSCAQGLGDANLKVTRTLSKVETAKNKLNDMNNTMHRINDAISKVTNSAKKAMPIIGKIPKVGSVVKTMNDMLGKVSKSFDQFTPIVESVKKTADTAYNITKKFNNGIGKVKKAVTAVQHSSAAATKIYDVVIPCAENTATCDDNTKLEDKHPNSLLSTAEVTRTAMKTCANAFDFLDNDFLEWLEKLLNAALMEVLEKVEEALTPVIDFITKILDKAMETFNRAFCCHSPFAFQQSADKISKVTNLATCAADGLLDALGSLVSDAILTLADPLLDELSGVLGKLKEFTKAGVNVPKINSLDVDISGCELKITGADSIISSEKVTFLSDTDINKMLAQIDSITLADRPTFNFNVGQAIKDACGESLDAIKERTENCCLHIENGYPAKKVGESCNFEFGLDKDNFQAKESCTMCATGKWGRVNWGGRKQCLPEKNWNQGTQCKKQCHLCKDKETSIYNTVRTCGCKIPGLNCGAGNCKECCDKKYHTPNGSVQTRCGAARKGQRLFAVSNNAVNACPTGKWYNVHGSVGERWCDCVPSGKKCTKKNNKTCNNCCSGGSKKKGIFNVCK